MIKFIIALMLLASCSRPSHDIRVLHASLESGVVKVYVYNNSDDDVWIKWPIYSEYSFYDSDLDEEMNGSTFPEWPNRNLHLKLLRGRDFTKAEYPKVRDDQIGKFIISPTIINESLNIDSVKVDIFPAVVEFKNSN